MIERFTVRPAPRGFAVYDLVRSEVAVLASTPQTGLSQADAEHTARLLNARASEDSPRPRSPQTPPKP